MADKKTHRLTITVTFDKPCSVAWARKEVRDNIHGTFYPFQRFGDDHGKWNKAGTEFESNDPGTFRVRSIK